MHQTNILFSCRKKCLDYFCSSSECNRKRACHIRIKGTTMSRFCKVEDLSYICAYLMRSWSCGFIYYNNSIIQKLRYGLCTWIFSKLIACLCIFFDKYFSLYALEWELLMFFH